MELVDEGLKPLDIFTDAALDDAFALDMAMGGSTNTVLHMLAAASEAGLEYDLDRINAISSRVPYICKVSPATPNVHMEDVHLAGGISAILRELDTAGLLNSDRPTVSGLTLRECIQVPRILGQTSFDRCKILFAKRAASRYCLAIWRPTDVSSKQEQFLRRCSHLVARHGFSKTKMRLLKASYREPFKKAKYL